MNLTPLNNHETDSNAFNQKKAIAVPFLRTSSFNFASISLVISLFVIALPAKTAERYVGDWFETEIILFSQLDDKEKLKEVFSKEFPLPNYRQEMDLLSAYLNPDINSLKQQLPLCNTPNYQMSAVEQAIELHKETFNPLTKMKSSFDFEPLEFSVLSGLDDLADAVRNNTSNSLQTNELQVNNEINEGSEFTLVNEFTEDNEENSSLEPQTDPSQTENPTALSEKDIQAIAQAEIAFNKFKFNPSYTEIIPINLCAISETQYQKLNVDKSRYSYLGFNVNKMPSTINAKEDIYSEVPYLINKNSLQLNSIVTQLKRSKNFKPLLHLGWRQQVFDPKRSVPLKLYAGDNLKVNYQVARAYYQQQKQQLLEQESELDNILSSDQVITDEEEFSQPSEQQLLEVAKQQRLAQLVEQVDSLGSSEQIIANLTNDLSIDISTQKALMPAPAPPIQPWYIDGFVKLHILENYLNITTDFNILNLTLAQQETLKLSAINPIEDKIKRIRLQQRRRVISSEIHYFDHPYMGMIIQIRKHKRPKPEIEVEKLNEEVPNTETNIN